MGTFLGHVAPGLFLYVFGFWTNVQLFIKFHHSRRRRVEFECTPTFKIKCPCCGDKKQEVEGVVKFIMCVTGILAEVITGIHCPGFCTSNTHHITMYTIFGLTGVIDILVHRQVTLPDNIQYCFLILAFGVEGLLFRFHLHGRSDLDVHVHTLLVYCIVFCVIALCIEMRFRHQAISLAVRAFSVLLQGSWFIQLGFILYSPFRENSSWDPENHEQIMLVTLIFAWHIVGNVLLVLVTALVVRCLCGAGKSRDYRYHSMEIEDIKTSSNGHAPLKSRDDSDGSDTEFQRTLP